MDASVNEAAKASDSGKKTHKKLNLKALRLSLRYRPEILKLILKMRHCIRQRSALIVQLKRQLKLLKNDNTKVNTIETKDSSCQTDSTSKSCAKDAKIKTNKEDAWDISKDNSAEQKSIAEQVKEVAQSALQQTGMVYVESAGMYYDYKTGYYYNSELGLYYHTDTGCYYYYSEEKKEFVFHSYPDRSAEVENPPLAAHQKKKAKKHKMAQKKEEDIDNLTKNFSQDKEKQDQATKKKRKKIAKKEKKIEPSDKEVKDESTSKVTENGSIEEMDISEKREGSTVKEGKEEMSVDKQELEDGECSETESESDGSQSDASTSTASDDDDAVAKHHPPCMRVIVRETNLPKLKVGSLFLVTKDGGTVGREGDQHTILLRDHNVSRNHLDIKYDMDKKMYTATDLGSKNGTVLNGIRMSESQIVSNAIEVMHGSTIQLGETKLLCHIHPGNDTCGHCEPGLIMETTEKETKVAYTRTCSVQKQHQLELARLKNKYAPKPLMIEETAYNDRAQARREAVGSSHHAEKTQTSDIDTFIAPENKGFKLLEKMGWSKGEGLGKCNQGDTEPIPLINNEGKTGLGAQAPPPTAPKPNNTLGPATLRLANRTKMLQPPAKAFQHIEDEEEE